jgi:hypothetical protein
MDEGFAVGRVARANPKHGVILCYFFGPKHHAIPTIAQMDHLPPEKAIRVLRIGDLSLVQGEWPLIGGPNVWLRSAWKIPEFLRRDEISGKAWRVRYSDADPNVIVDEQPESPRNNTLERDCVLGAGAVEAVLSKLLEYP